MEKEEKIRAYIIKEMVDRNKCTGENLQGINYFLNSLTEYALDKIATELIAGYETPDQN